MAEVENGGGLRQARECGRLVGKTVFLRYARMPPEVLDQASAGVISRCVAQADRPGDLCSAGGCRCGAGALASETGSRKDLRLISGLILRGCPGARAGSEPGGQGKQHCCRLWHVTSGTISTETHLLPWSEIMFKQICDSAVIQTSRDFTAETLARPASATGSLKANHRGHRDSKHDFSVLLTRRSFHKCKGFLNHGDTETTEKSGLKPLCAKGRDGLPRQDWFWL